LLHVELGRYYLGLASVGLMPAHDAVPQARAQARAAMALDHIDA
jgi:hypothetical protein